MYMLQALPFGVTVVCIFFVVHYIFVNIPISSTREWQKTDITKIRWFNVYCAVS